MPVAPITKAQGSFQMNKLIQVVCDLSDPCLTMYLDSEGSQMGADILMLDQLVMFLEIPFLVSEAIPSMEVLAKEDVMHHPLPRILFQQSRLPYRCIL